MSRLDNQRRLFLELVETLRPHWRRDPGLPARLQHWLAAHRAGSRDRRLYRELIYTTWRVLPWVEQSPPDELVGIVATCAMPQPATLPFIEAFRLPALPAACDPALLLPDWLADECPAALVPAQRDALLARAPLWLRHQAGDAAEVRGALEASGWRIAPAPVLPSAWRADGERDITTSAAFQHGQVEIQDLGSQLLMECVRPQGGETWLDACAGAGGKTLQLDALVGPSGAVTAHDIRPSALAELAERARRLPRPHRINVTSRLPAPDRRFDGVLVDAPCTGSGTWRRSPHLKWTTGPAQIRHAAARQRALLDQFATFVRPGGRLVYATCSLCRSENEAVVAAFLTDRPQFQADTLHPPAPLQAGAVALRLLPADVDSDAFFVAALRRAG